VHAIFDQLALYAGYGFNRAHSAAYGWLSYQTAYLKHHFPDEFRSLSAPAARKNR
jgi:DNA polymerase-3 subunit alpha